jgi:hypothetical protein
MAPRRSFIAANWIVLLAAIAGAAEQIKAKS